MSLPALWTPEQGLTDAKKSDLIGIYGQTKTGKSELCTSTNLNLYYAHLDPHDNIDEHLLARKAKGYLSPVHLKKYPPMPYKNLTKEEAQRRVEDLEQFAADARAECVTKGQYGLFVIDGARWLKGYIEKWKLGDSATLGYRAKSGEKGVASIEYAESNSYFADIVNSFVGSNVSLAITFEGREKWVESQGENGRKSRRPSGRFEARIPGDVSFSFNALVETVVEAVPTVVVDMKQQYEFVHKLRFEYLGYVGMSYMRGRTIPASGFDAMINLLRSELPEAENLVVEPKHEIRRMDMDDDLTPPGDGDE